MSSKTSATADLSLLESIESTSPKKIDNIDDEISSANEKPSCSKHLSEEDARKAKLLSIAPKLPFDIDLYHWEDEKVEAPTLLT